MAHEAGKGSKQRPTDYSTFATNYDAIFRKNPDAHVSEGADGLFEIKTPEDAKRYQTQEQLNG